MYADSHISRTGNSSINRVGEQSTGTFRGKRVQLIINHTPTNVQTHIGNLFSAKPRKSIFFVRIICTQSKDKPVEAEKLSAGPNTLKETIKSTFTKRDKIIENLKKCLEVSNSKDQSHEAETAGLHSDIVNIWKSIVKAGENDKPTATNPCFYNLRWTGPESELVFQSTKDEFEQITGISYEECPKSATREQWRKIGIDPARSLNENRYILFSEAVQTGIDRMQRQPNEASLKETLRKDFTTLNDFYETEFSNDLVTTKLNFRKTNLVKSEVSAYYSTSVETSNRFFLITPEQDDRVAVSVEGEESNTHEKTVSTIPLVMHLVISASYDYRDVHIINNDHPLAYPRTGIKVQASSVFEYQLLKRQEKNPSFDIKTIQGVKINSFAGVASVSLRAIRAVLLGSFQIQTEIPPEKGKFPRGMIFILNRPRDGDRSVEALAFYAVMGLANSSAVLYLGQHRGRQVEQIHLLPGGAFYSFIPNDESAAKSSIELSSQF